MKKNLLVFETVFAAGIIACLVLPSVIMAKPHRIFKIMIRNGDTTINGKNSKTLRVNEREKGSKHPNGINRK